MQQKEINDILKDLTAAKKRIDKQKNELTKELTKLEAAASATEQGEKPAGEAFSISAILNGTQTSEEINRKIASIKAALDLPYYADSEYRKLSIAYFEAVTEAEAAELDKNANEMEAAKTAIAEAEERLEKLKKQSEDIKAAAAEKISDVGLIGVSYFMMDYSPEYALEKYKKVCDRYN